MGLRTTTLSRIRRLSRAHRLSVFASVLAHGDTRECDAAVAELLELSESSRDDLPVLTILRAWQRLSRDSMRTFATVRSERVYQCLVQLADSDRGSDRALASRLAGVAASGQMGEIAAAAVPLLGILSSLLRDTSPSVQAGAARSIATISKGMSTDDVAGHVALDGPLAQAAALYPEHRCDEVLRQTLRWAQNPGPALRSWLGGASTTGADAADAAHMALRSQARKLPAEDQPELLAAWLAHPVLAPVVLDRLGADPELAAVEHVLCSAHLAGAWGISSKDRRLLGIARTVASPGGFARLSAAARAGAVRWLADLPLPPDTVLGVIGRCVADADVHVRQAAVVQLANAGDKLGSGRKIDGSLFEFALDGNESVAVSAVSALVRTTSASRRFALVGNLKMLTRSPHERVRRVASRSLRAFDPLTGGIATARRLLKADRDRMVSLLREAMRSANAADRVNSIDLAQKLNMLNVVELELLGAAGGSDTRVASKAVLALAHVHSNEAQAALNAALFHKDGRVRANAAEAARVSAQHKSRLMELTTDQTPRVRANAIWGLLSEPKHVHRGESELLRMLADDRAGHRLSAVWLAGKAQCVSMAGKVADIARTETDIQVRAKAVRTSGQLFQGVRDEWGAQVSANSVMEGAP